MIFIYNVGVNKVKDNHSAPFNQEFLFHFIGIDCISHSLQRSYPFLSISQHTLLFFINGSGTLFINDMPYLVTKGKCFLVHPHSSIDLSDMDEHSMFYKISFLAFQLVEKNLPILFQEHLFSSQVAYNIYPYTRCMQLAEELYRRRSQQDGLKQQARFYELLNIVYEQQSQMNNSFNPSKAVEQTIEYIHTYYQKPLTVKELAELAQVPQWQYSEIFQALTGKKPLDYLTDIRLHNAKELLQQTDEPLKNIAHLVGFNDEYYFNRRFRQIVGMPPKQFAHLQRRRTTIKDWTGHEVEIPLSPKRVIYHGETFGDMFVFNILPIGGDKTSISKSCFQNHVPLVQDVAFPIDAEKSAQLNPDLIIFTNDDEELYRTLTNIAPTVKHNSWGTLDERINLLGQWLQQTQQAKNWLTRFKLKENMMWQQLQHLIKPGETASVFIFDHGQRLFAMGCTGLSPSLYHPNGFQPQKQIKTLIQDEIGYQEISIELLPEYAGEHIFMLLPDKPESKLATIKLLNSALWNSLPAVHNKRFYLMDANRWNFNDAFTREKLLGAIPRLLKHSF